MDEEITLNKAIEMVYDPYESVQRESETRMFLSEVENNLRYAD